ANRFLRHAASEIGLAHHPDELAAVDDGQPTYGVLLHRAHGFFDQIVGPDRDHLGGWTDLAYGGASGVAARGDDLHGHVAVGDHSLEVALAVAYRQGADVEFCHLPCR